MLMLQVRESAAAVRGVVMALVGCKAAAQHLWLPLLFHTIPVMEACHPTVFGYQDTQQLLARTQVGFMDWLQHIEGLMQHSARKRSSASCSTSGTPKSHVPVWQ